MPCLKKSHTHDQLSLSNSLQFCGDDALPESSVTSVLACVVQQGVFLSYLSLFLSSLSYSTMDIGVLYTILMAAMTVGSYTLPALAHMPPYNLNLSYTHFALLNHAIGSLSFFALIFLPANAPIAIPGE